MSKNNGKEAEKNYLSVLKVYMDSDPKFIYGRFTDTHDARSFVAPAPSDYYATYDSQPWLVEIKSSIDPARFPLKNISGSQLGFALRYSKAGWKSIFIIFSYNNLCWYFVPLAVVYEKFKSKNASWKWEELEPFKQDVNFKFWSIL